MSVLCGDCADLMGSTLTRAPELPPEMGRIRHLKGDGDEAVEVHGRADPPRPCKGRFVVTVQSAQMYPASRE
jgi:hypothetical protein